MVVCYIIFCHLLHIGSGKTENLLSLLLCSLWWVQIIGYVLACRSYSFVQYTISLSSLCKLIWRHWLFKMPVRHILSSVWVRFRIFSQLSIIQYMGLCVFSLPISLVMIERIYIVCLIIIKSEVWTSAHGLGLGHESMVCVVCLSIFLLMCDMAGLLRGTFVSWWYLPRIWPSVTDMQHYYHARYPTDDWHLAYMFSLVYFSVEVCLEGVFPHSVSTRWDPSSGSMYPSHSDKLQLVCRVCIVIFDWICVIDKRRCIV